MAGAFYVGNGWVAGGMGVAGMMTLLVMKWIIPENSLLSTSKSKVVCNNYADLCTMQSSKGCFLVCMVSKIDQH